MNTLLNYICGGGGAVLLFIAVVLACGWCADAANDWRKDEP